MLIIKKKSRIKFQNKSDHQGNLEQSTEGQQQCQPLYDKLFGELASSILQLMGVLGWAVLVVDNNNKVNKYFFFIIKYLQLRPPKIHNTTGTFFKHVFLSLPTTKFKIIICHVLVWTTNHPYQSISIDLKRLPT